MHKSLCRPLSHFVEIYVFYFKLPGVILDIASEHKTTFTSISDDDLPQGFGESVSSLVLS